MCRKSRSLILPFTIRAFDTISEGGMLEFRIRAIFRREWCSANALYHLLTKFLLKSGLRWSQ